MTRPLWQAIIRLEQLDKPWINQRADPGDPDRIHLGCTRCGWIAEFLSSYQAWLAYDAHHCQNGGEAA